MFMDDMLLLAWAKTLAESNTKVKCMMVRQDGGLDWEMAHQSDFALDKFGIMGLTRRRELNLSGNSKTRPIQRHPIFLHGMKVLAISTHKFLGVIIDKELQWREHVDYAICKGTNWVTQYCRLAKPSKGTSAKFMRPFYISIAVPKCTMPLTSSLSQRPVGVRA